MKSLSICVFILLQLSLVINLQSTKAQTYRAVKADAKYFFIDSTSRDIIALRIDSIKTTGNDTIYFGFRQLKPTDYGCYTINGGSWIGDEVTEKPDGTFIFTVYPFSPPDSSNTYRILTRRLQNQPWIFYNYHNVNHHIEAVVTEIKEMSFLGLNDSIKVITLTRKDASGQLVADPVNNQQILLSKNYGLIRLPKFDDFLDYCLFYDIVGKTNPETGVTNLTTMEIFDYQPGDEFHIVWHDQSFPVPFTIMDGATIMRILERNQSVTDDSVTYRMEVCQSSQYQFSPTEFSYSHTFDTVYRTFSSSGTPELETEPLEPVATFNDWTTYTYMGFMTNSILPIYDRPVKLINNSMMWSHQDDCYSQIMFDGCIYSSIYIKGLGGPYYNCYDFGWGSSYNLLKYYKKDGVSWGTPLSCDSLMQVGIKELIPRKMVSVSPNPTSGTVNINAPLDLHLPGSFELFDLSGRPVAVFTLQLHSQDFDLSCLPAGLYNYRILLTTGEVFRGKIIRQ